MKFAVLYLSVVAAAVLTIAPPAAKANSGLFTFKKAAKGLIFANENAGRNWILVLDPTTAEENAYDATNNQDTVEARLFTANVPQSRRMSITAGTQNVRAFRASPGQHVVLAILLDQNGREVFGGFFNVTIPPNLSDQTINLVIPSAQAEPPRFRPREFGLAALGLGVLGGVSGLGLILARRK